MKQKKGFTRRREDAKDIVALPHHRRVKVARKRTPVWIPAFAGKR
ncbi:hypothetical protein [Blastomonas sp.]|nr:hypothetical protein [Blastomonas sp.]